MLNLLRQYRFCSVSDSEWNPSTILAGELRGTLYENGCGFNHHARGSAKVGGPSPTTDSSLVQVVRDDYQRLEESEDNEYGSEVTGLDLGEVNAREEKTRNIQRRSRHG